MKKRQATKWRPFHEAVVDAIREASGSDMVCLARLIKVTAIPKGHRMIIAAWNRRRDQLVWGDLGVTAILLKQKKEAERKAKKKAKE